MTAIWKQFLGHFKRVDDSVLWWLDIERKTILADKCHIKCSIRIKLITIFISNNYLFISFLFLFLYSILFLHTF